MSDIAKFDAPYPLGEIPAFSEHKSVSVHDCSAGYFMAYAADCSVADFSEYVELLLSQGYEITAENTITDNRFVTLRNVGNGLRVHTYFIQSAGEIRVVVSEWQGDLPSKQDYESVCSTKVCQINAAHGIPGLDEGMSFVIRLSDGRFIIIDGGYRRGVCGKDVYDTLKALAPDPEHIKVAAWILTHYHGDHVGGFLEFAEMYGDDRSVSVECFVFNFPSDPVFCQNLAGDHTARVGEYAALYYPGASVYTAQTGEIYEFANARIEMLFTPQDYMPRTIENEADGIEAGTKKGDGNNLSLVFRIDFGKNTFFVMADTTTVCCDEMCRRYGSYMKSDYVQASHHGLSKPTPRAHNATKEIYDAISPEYAFMPCSATRYEVRREYEVNVHLANMVKKIYVAGEGTVSIDFDGE